MMPNEPHKIPEVEIPKLKGNINQILSDAAMNSPAVLKLQQEAEQRRIEKRRHNTNVAVAVVGIFLTLALAFVVWIYPHLGEELATWLKSLFQTIKET